MLPLGASWSPASQTHKPICPYRSGHKVTPVFQKLSDLKKMVLGTKAQARDLRDGQVNRKHAEHESWDGRDRAGHPQSLRFRAAVPN